LKDIVLSYGDHRGKLEFRQLIASENGLQAENVLVTAGAAAALFIVSSTILEKTDHILVAKPNYATNIETPRAIGASLSFLPLRFEENYEIDVNELESKITNNTKLVSLTYPHNPTGVLISEEKLRQIIRIIEKKGIHLLLDETYREMSFLPMLPLAATLSDRVISVSSMSKSFGLPGIRIGWIITGDEQLLERFLAAKEQIFITNSVLDEEIAHQFLIKKAQLFPPIWETIRKNFSTLKKFIAGQEILEWVEPKGGCICFPRVKSEIPFQAKRFHEILLERYRTYVGPGHWFEEEERNFRIGYSWETPEKLLKGLNNILMAIEDQKE
ncbi:MAG: pyridoxal phosphate-dependent aminotransferase, partial [Chitinophagales bacterium]